MKLAIFALTVLLLNLDKNTYAQTAVNTQLWENVVYEGNVLNDKGYAYYQLTVTGYIFDGSQSLAVKVLPEQYNSDPDLFISTNNSNPTSSFDSQWFCTKIGSDTCIIDSSQLSVGLILYIGVQCINPCEYTIATYYAPTIQIPDSNTTQLRLNGYSSTIFSYLVPSTNSNGITRAVEFKINSETQYTPIDLYFSIDSTIYQVEERKNEDILSNGVGYTFTENDYGWCTGCYVYLLADVINDDRYYVTFTATTRAKVITATPTDMMVNPRQEECVLYYILTAANDLFITADSYQGTSDFYVAGSTKPVDNTDSKILQFAARTSHRTLVVTAEDRARWGFTTGVINICAYAFTQSSLVISPYEDNAGGRFDAGNLETTTFNIESNSSTYFRFTQASFTQNGYITVTATTYGLNANQAPARVFYQICNYTDPNACSLNSTQQRGVGMIELASGTPTNLTNNGQTRNASFFHNSSRCIDPNNCYYLINVFFADVNGPKKIDFVVGYNTSVYEPVTLDQRFENILEQGQYFYYALLPGSSEGFAYLKSLTIKLVSEIGDADLVVSVVDSNPEIDQNQFEARGSETYDSISLNNTGNFSLARPIYIGIYAQTFCVYTVSFEPQYTLDYNAKLVSAIPIVDSIAYYNIYYTEFDETFYSFYPWWAGYENRSMIFFGNVIFNNIFFHIRANDYPMYYLDEYKDINDIIVINPGDEDYSLNNGYYIRIRPDFQLQDLISSRQYIFNFYAFTQVQNTRLVDIQLNELKFGYANRSSVFYRHFIVENNATYNFSVIPIIGNPSILLKLSNVIVFPRSTDTWSWDYKTNNPGLATDSIIVTYIDRSSRNASCMTAGFNLNAGNRSCGFYVAVECSTAECIFNITVQIKGRENQALPKYLLEDDYYTGQVSYGQYSYFYYPLSNATGEMVIIVNKTANLYQNGDLVVLANIMGESQSKAISNWSYPNVTNYNIASSNYRPNQAEIVELCSSVISSKCTSNSCILMLGILGLTKNLNSNFRIIVHSQGNKLYNNNPIVDSIATAGQYKYYWFTSNVSVSNPSAAWQYQILSAPTVINTDVDLYVSILDGRYPVTEDYDFASENMGADSIFINSTTSFFNDAGYNKSNGILFIVGVKALTNNVQFNLMMSGPSTTTTVMTNLTTGLYASGGLLGSNANNRTNYYKWYNWGQKDFRLNIEVSAGNLTAYLNFISEEIFLNNGFLALPINPNNSQWTVYLNASQAGVLTVSKNNYGAGQLFCYFCWYYITINTNYTAGPTAYRLSINSVPDVGEEITVITLNTSTSLTLPATGTVSQRKFILDGKDPFQIQAKVTSGYLNMFVGLYPDAPKTKYQFYAEGSSTITISVKQTDGNFKVGAWYYITLQSGSGKTVFSLSVNQRRTVNQLYSGVISKDQYWNSQEQIKFYMFQAPTQKTPQYRAVINIQSLSPGFYPTVLLYKQQLTAAPSDITKLTYPNMNMQNISFGDNFFAIANQNNFTYQFRDTGGSYIYYTIALYAFSYGMTDMRKPEFKITLIIDNNTLSSGHESFSSKFSIPKYFNSKNTQDRDQIELNWEEVSDSSTKVAKYENNQKSQNLHFSKHQGHEDAFEFLENLGNGLSKIISKASNYLHK